MSAGKSDSVKPADPYTAEMRLCGDAGIVTPWPIEGEPFATVDASYLARHNRLRNMSRRARGDKPEDIVDAFPCTGHAHLAGEHIRCTSPAHNRDGGT